MKNSNPFHANNDHARAMNRRSFLSRSALGFGSIALQSLLHQEAQAIPGPGFGMPHRPAKAKNVIWLFMRGGVSHMESFDPKPALNQYQGKSIGETPFSGVQSPESTQEGACRGDQ
jgi:hypothetical protein